uniref:Uncharacterized protein n=1 Tax=Aegilops tauschii subsp. strangulata TaxID=200361 RepID=A0A453H3P2_AEGTS
VLLILFLQKAIFSAQMPYLQYSCKPVLITIEGNFGAKLAVLLSVKITRLCGGAVTIASYVCSMECCLPIVWCSVISL